MFTKIQKMEKKPVQFLLTVLCRNSTAKTQPTIKGKYKHHRHGLMEDIAHIKLIRGVIIILESDLEKVLTFLKEYNAEIYTRDITLTREDEKTLNKENQ